MKGQFGFHDFLRFPFRRIQKQKAGREKRPASRGYGNLQTVNPAKKVEWCSTKGPLPGKGLSRGEAAVA
jgi:hypothetical protein